VGIGGIVPGTSGTARAPFHLRLHKNRAATAVVTPVPPAPLGHDYLRDAENARCAFGDPDPIATVFFYFAWARETFAKMEPFFASARYVNYLGDDETGEPVAAAYGPNYRRLQQLKKKYDPKNFFRMNQNIRPLA
jgi:FAD/FMN-containing dehydrogenase